MTCYDPVSRYSLVVRPDRRSFWSLDSPCGAAGPCAGTLDSPNRWQRWIQAVKAKPAPEHARHSYSLAMSDIYVSQRRGPQKILWFDGLRTDGLLRVDDVSLEGHRGGWLRQPGSHLSAQLLRRVCLGTEREE